MKLDSGGAVQLTIGMVLHEGNIQVGCRVQRGPHWVHGEQDGGEGQLGTVLGYRCMSGVAVGLCQNRVPAGLCGILIDLLQNEANMKVLWLL